MGAEKQTTEKVGFHNHILPLFAFDGCVQDAYRILVNPTSGGSRLLREIPTNLYLSISTVTLPLWRRDSFHDVYNTYPQNITVIG